MQNCLTCLTLIDGRCVTAKCEKLRFGREVKIELEAKESDYELPKQVEV